MYKELGIEPSALAVAQHYGSLLNALIIDRIDQEFTSSIKQTGIIPHVTDTLMVTIDDRRSLANEVLVLGQSISRRSSNL
jgi:LPPG:FO 2-phospho-L-lactate transferase